MTRTIETIAEMPQLVDEVLAMLPQRHTAQVLALHGELGAGKTAFTQALAKRLGVTKHVTSPTFVIMRTYATTHDTFTRLVHIDAYRVEDVAEVAVLHIPEYYEQAGTVLCVEWPERIAAIMPETVEHIYFTVGDNDARTVTYGNN